jgi:hypothetical protein
MIEPKKGDPNWVEWRTCKRKIRYEAPLNLPIWCDYFCPYCGGWHVTSDLRKKEKWHRNIPTGWIGA